MDESTKSTLATIENCIVGEVVSVHAALLAAYRLGVVDGQLQMADVALKKIEKLPEAA